MLRASEPISKQPIDAPAEAFGQRGMRHLFFPLLNLGLLILASVAGAMSLRSANITDVVRYGTGASIYTMRSAYGRVSFSRRDFAYDAGLSGRWDYELAPLPQVHTDPWPDSLGKTLGIEWTRIAPNGALIGGWVGRIRWPLIMIVAGIWPLVHSIKRTIVHYRARRSN